MSIDLVSSDRSFRGRVAGVIPARYASTRFPGKPLCDICGKTMIQRVYERALRSQLLDFVLVATDDERIRDTVRSFGGDVSMTSPDHPDGSSRVAEAVRDLDCQIIINIQGDEPFIDPRMIDETVECLIQNPDVHSSTLCFAITDPAMIEDPGIVKVVRDRNSRALYFSRSPVPFMRNRDMARYLGHIGIYGYRREFLFRYIELEATPLSRAESLEQLKILEHGYKMIVPETAFAHEAPGIDTPEDLEAARIFCSNNPEMCT